MKWRQWRSTLEPMVNLALFGVAVYAIDHVLRDYRYDDVLLALRSLPVSDLLAALGLTALGYLALVGYDVVGFRYLRFPLPLRSILLPSFISFAVANSAPASVITGGGVRYHVYRGAGLTSQQAAQLAVFNVLTYCSGLFVLAGGTLLVTGGSAVVHGVSARVVGAVLVLLAMAYALVTWRWPGVRALRRWTIAIPSLRTARWQFAVSIADWLLSSAALYVLLQAVEPIGYLPFLGAFLLAQMTALLLPVPGGIGVFEAVVLLLRPASAGAPQVLAALLAYRVIYYLLPLILAGVGYGWLWWKEALRAGVERGAMRARLRALLPSALSYTTFLAGMLMLITGAIPQNDRRLAWLGALLPLSVIEASHLLGSITGAILVILAWGLERRNRTAYRIIRALFFFGIILTLGRSADLRLAIVMAMLFLVLLLAGHEFPRVAPSLNRQPLHAGWTFLVGAVFILEVWLIAVLLRHSELRGEVWWRFALFSEAPRALRAAVAAAVIILLFGLVRLVSARSDEP